MINSVNLEGRLTKDPELKRVDDKTVYVKVNIAVRRGFGSEADFIPIIVWNKQAEQLAKHKHKGDLISIGGSLRSGSYENSNGDKVQTLVVKARTVTFLGNAKKSGSTNSNYTSETKEKEKEIVSDTTNRSYNENFDENTNVDSNNEFLKFASSAPTFSW